MKQLIMLDILELFNETRQIAQGVNVLNEICDEGATQSSLIKLSKNPIKNVSEFYKLILKITKDIQIVDSELEKNKINENGLTESSHYDDEKRIIEESVMILDKIGGLSNVE